MIVLSYRSVFSIKAMKIDFIFLILNQLDFDLFYFILNFFLFNLNLPSILNQFHFFKFLQFLTFDFLLQINLKNQTTSFNLINKHSQNLIIKNHIDN